MTPFILSGDHATPLRAGLTLLEASAGTGKTYAIAGLVARLVLEAGIAIERIAVMTFTTAATAELRDRIRGRLTAVAAACAAAAPSGSDALTAWLRDRYLALPPAGQADWRRRLRAATGALDLAAIATIHGFARRLAVEHAADLGLDPSADLDTDLRGWRTGIVHDWVRTHLRAAPAPVLALIGADPVASLDALAKRAEQAPSAEVAEAALSVDEVVAQAQVIASEWPDVQAAAEAELVRCGPGLSGKTVFGKDRALDRLARLEGLLVSGVPTDNLDSDLHITIPEKIAKGTKKGFPPLAHAPFLAIAPIVERWLGLGPALRAGFIREYRARLQARIRTSQVAHVDDPMRALDAAFASGAGAQLAEAVGRRHDAVLVDEFQDTDQRQWRILARCFAGGRHHLLLIGDPKQAIYRFRGADIHAYLVAREQVPPARRFTLATNFRSDAALIAAINRLYLGAGTPRVADPFALPGIAYVAVTAHHRDDRFRSGRLDAAPLRILRIPAERALKAQVARAAVADAVADETARLLDRANGVQLRASAEDALGPLRPGDIAVIVRGHHEGDLVARALQARGIAAVRNDRASVFAAGIAPEFADLLGGCLDPRGEYALRRAAATRLVGVPVEAFAAEADPRLAALPERLLALGERLRGEGVAAWWLAAQDTDFGWGTPRLRISALPDGERHLADLAHLGELAASAQAEQHLPAAGVARWFEQQLAEPAEGSDAVLRRIERDDAAVQIVTVHVAKGLQYPVVFEAFAWRSTRCDDDGDGTLVHAADGAVRWHLASTDPAHADHAAREALGDDLRKLYVGLTRAEHRCYLLWADQPAHGQHHGSTRSALGQLLVAPDFSAQVAEPLVALAARLATSASDDLSALTAATGIPLTVVDHSLPMVPGVALPAAAAAPPTATILPAQAIAPRWYRSSFTGLCRAIGDADSDGRDHDQASADRDHPDDGLPAGADFGTIIHRLYEHADPQAWAASPAAPRAAVQAALEHAGFRVTAEAIAGLAARLHASVALEVPGVGERLAALPARALVREWPVRLPVARRSATLDASFAGRTPQAPDWPRRLAQVQIPSGTFEGVVDAVVHANGRWHVIDWKSNRLPSYAPDALWQAMAEHDYLLQANLYLVAVHRWLRLRLGAGYRPFEHLGCAAYAFIRGIDPLIPGAGWVVVQPDLDLIAALDACFAPMEGAAHA